MAQAQNVVNSFTSTQCYETAVTTLNILQTKNISAETSFTEQHTKIYNVSKLEDTMKYILRSGLTMEQINSLQIIHVAGTKGKGSTCAFTESILRNHGFLTGFYSSPHLISVRERFRINGQPINEPTFCYHFWKLYKILESKKNHEYDMPQYFKFLTIMMFHLFLHFKVDVAIIEVGIGGENDCTNVIKNPICTGITNLHLDHTSILGDTIEKIAFHKSGIFKPLVPAFTVPQTIEAMNVLEKRAVEKNCTLKVVSSIENYDWISGPPPLGISAEFQKYNASLAIQLASTWMNSVKKLNELHKINLDKNEILLDEFHNSKLMINSKLFSFQNAELGISSCKWPGRTQILRGEKIDFFIDGAHTMESINTCVSWFKGSIKNEPGKRFLIFNATGNRDVENLMKPLKTLKFFRAFFPPNIAGIKNVDQEILKISTEKMKINCRNNCKIWGEGSVYVDNIKDAVNHILDIYNSTFNLKNKDKPKVLVTGSFHLVGALLFIIDPDLNMKSKF